MTQDIQKQHAKLRKEVSTCGVGCDVLILF